MNLSKVYTECLLCVQHCAVFLEKYNKRLQYSACLGEITFYLEEIKLKENITKYYVSHKPTILFFQLRLYPYGQHCNQRFHFERQASNKEYAEHLFMWSQKAPCCGFATWVTSLAFYCVIPLHFIMMVVTYYHHLHIKCNSCF